MLNPFDHDLVVDATRTKIVRPGSAESAFVVAGPGSEVPREFVELVEAHIAAVPARKPTDPDPVAKPTDTPPDPDGAASDDQSDATVTDGEDAPGDQGEDAVADPPAKNAKREEWAAYAQALGVAFTDDDGRNEIIAAVEKHQADA